MKTLLFFLLPCACLLSAADAPAQRYSTTSGQTQFFSETPVENIRAINKKSQVIFDAATGELAVRIPIRDFTFPNKLMQEHFNENYMESEKYPTATFSGKLSSLPDHTRNGTYSVVAKGKLTVHGVTQEREIQGQFIVKDGSITMMSDFEVALTDHKIEVPKLVFVKIAQQIQVKTEYVLSRQ